MTRMTRMTRAQAVRIAIVAMVQMKRKFAFDSKSHDWFGENNPTAINASKLYHNLDEAIKILEESK